MKKLLASLLAVAMTFALVSCGNSDTPPASNPHPPTPPPPTRPPPPPPPPPQSPQQLPQYQHPPRHP